MTFTNKKLNWQDVLHSAKAHQSSLISAHIIALAAVICNVPIPLLMPLLVDEVLLGQAGVLVHGINTMFPASVQGPVLYISLVLFATLSLRLSAIVLGVWQTYKFSSVSKDLTYKIRRELLLRLPFVSMSEYETLDSGQFASHLVTDINVIDDFISTTVSKFVIAVLSLIGITLILIWMHWQLALFIIFLNPVVIFFTVKMGKRVKDLKRKENRSFELFQQSLNETMLAIKQIRAYNREEHYINRLVKRAANIKDQSTQFIKKSDAASRLSMGVFLIGFDCFRAISMMMVVFSDLTVGQMMAVFGYLWFMMSPVQEILNVQYSFFSAKGAMERINQFISLKNEPQYETNENPFEHRNTVSIQIRDLEFAYGEEKVLNGVNLDIQAGEKIALVGASGAGKTTLIQIILGLYPVQQGMLFFDHVPVTSIGLSRVRENVATVLQHPALFNDTIRNNVTLGKDYPDDKVLWALEVAQLKDLLQNLNHGLDSVVGQQGVRLSGGERQRVAIARMLISQPKVIIFDEATSALDTQTERNLYQQMNPLIKDLTCIIIAHRLSAVKQADRVYVFEDGKIVEQGPHEELIKLNGLYYKLYGKSVKT